MNADRSGNKSAATQSAPVWCQQATRAIAPYASSNLTKTVANPFRLPAIQHGGLAALRHALDQTVAASNAPLPGMEELTTPQGLPIVEHWRQVARAASQGEHDFDAGLGSGRLDSQQTHTLIGDVAATVRALVVLDQRYANIPGWEKLHRAEQLGWSALACALDASMEPPDYAIDMRGWRPKAKVIDGPAKPGLLGVLQAEHNLAIRMQTFPNAMNLRLVVDSQRLLSGGLARIAAKIDPDLQQQWLTRERIYVDLQRELRNVGGRLGKGGLAVAEGAKAIGRLKKVRPDADLDPRLLHAFTTLFNRLDDRIADIIETGIERNAYFARVKVSVLAENSGELVAPSKARFIPLAMADHATLTDLVRKRLRPPPAQPPLRQAKRSRAELYSALVHQPTRGAPRDVPSI